MPGIRSGLWNTCSQREDKRVLSDVVFHEFHEACLYSHARSLVACIDVQLSEDAAFVCRDGVCA